jgi:ribbon-helix-helix CopG family protein
MSEIPDRRKPGRPKGSLAPIQHYPVSTRLNEKDLDRLIRLANEREQSVSATLRDLLRQRLP